MLFTGLKWSVAVNGPGVLLNLPRSSLLVTLCVLLLLLLFYLRSAFLYCISFLFVCSVFDPVLYFLSVLLYCFSIVFSHHEANGGG